DQRHRYIELLGDEVEIALGASRQIGIAPAFSRRLLPAWKLLVDWLHAPESSGNAGQVPVGFAGLAIAVGGANFDFIKTVQDVQLGDGQTVEAVDAHGIAAEHRIQPTAATRSACGHTDFRPGCTSLPKLLADVAKLLGRERTFTDAGLIRLRDAN